MTSRICFELISHNCSVVNVWRASWTDTDQGFFFAGRGRRGEAGQPTDFLEDVSVRRTVQTLRGLMGRLSGRREENFRAAFVELWPAARRVARRLVGDQS